jgi:glycosyltransferase involved in cell wall biosynthesis
MRICHINFSLGLGGAENLLVDIINEQVKTTDVSLIIVNKNYDPGILKRVSKAVQTILINRPQGNKKNPFHIFRLWLTLYKVKPDVIHCHTPNLIQILMPFKKRCVYTIHTVGTPLTHLYKYKKLFAISEAVKDDVKKRSGLDSFLVYNGIDFPKFKKKDTYHYNSSDTFKIIQVGRLKHQIKGQDLLIESLSHLMNTYHIEKVHLDIVGNGTSEKYLESLAQKLGLKEFITFKGLKDRSWIYENLCQYHLLVQPSRYEGFGLTAIEAIAAGLIVVASAIDGPLEILNGIPSVILFETENIQDLTLKIKDVINSYISNNQIEERCKSSSDIIENRYSLTSTAKNYLSYYADLLPNSAATLQKSYK